MYLSQCWVFLNFAGLYECSKLVSNIEQFGKKKKKYRILSVTESYQRHFWSQNMERYLFHILSLFVETTEYRTGEDDCFLEYSKLV